MPIDKIPLNLIEDNPFQPRRTYHKEDIDSLAASIKANGLLQVPPARRTKGGIQLAFGHLRLRAFKKLAEKSEKWSRMPLDIREITDEDMALFALEENLKRRDITPIDVARALNKYLESFPKQTELQLANKVGMTQGNVSNMRRVLRLPAKVLDKIDEGRITFTMGRELLVLQGFKADEDVTDEELMLLAIRGVQVPGSQNDMRKPFTVEGLQRSIHEVACARFFTLDKEHADSWSYYAGKELLFDAEASGCFKCEKVLRTHPTKTGVANWCTDKTCWLRHQEDYKEARLAMAAKQKVDDKAVKGVAETKNISQEISESGDSGPNQQAPVAPVSVVGTVSTVGTVSSPENVQQAKQAGQAKKNAEMRAIEAAIFATDRLDKPRLLLIFRAQLEGKHVHDLGNELLDWLNNRLEGVKDEAGIRMPLMVRLAQLNEAKLITLLVESSLEMLTFSGDIEHYQIWTAEALKTLGIDVNIKEKVDQKLTEVEGDE